MIGDLGQRRHFFFFYVCVRYLSKYFAQVYRAQYGAAMLVYLQGRRRPENSVTMWNLLQLYVGD